MMKHYETIVDANKEAADAFMQLHALFVGGLHEMSSHACDIARNAFDLHLETGKSAMTIKSLQELAELQSKWVRECFNTALSSATKLSQISTKLAHQVAEPVQAHICNSMSRIADNVTSITKLDLNGTVTTVQR
jgi:phasin family protein